MGGGRAAQVDRIIEGNHPIVERNHIVVLADKWDDQVVSLVKALDAVAGPAPTTLSHLSPSTVNP